MVQISADIPASLKAALEEKAARDSGGVSSIITAALAHYLEKPIHTVFQVSTSGALVAGVYDREVSVQALLEHGDFGLGTFADLDGEMVVVDGRAYQIQGSGSVSEAPAGAGAPFGVVTQFEPSIDVSIRSVAKFQRFRSKLRPVPALWQHLLRTSARRPVQECARKGCQSAKSRGGTGRRCEGTKRIYLHRP